MVNACSGSTSCFGFDFTSAGLTDVVLLRCVASNLRATTSGSYYGIYAPSSVGSTIKDCVVTRNEGTTMGTSYGIQGNASSRLVGNFAYRNAMGTSTQLATVNDTATTQSTAYEWENLWRVTPT